MSKDQGLTDSITEPLPSAAQAATYRAALEFYAKANVLTRSPNNPNGGGWPDDGWEARRALNTAPNGDPYPPTPEDEERQRGAARIVANLLNGYARAFANSRPQSPSVGAHEAPSTTGAGGPHSPSPPLPKRTNP